MAPRAVTLIAMLVLVWQGIVFQAHTHLAARHPVAASRAAAASGLPRTDDPATCPICRQVARAGRYLAPAPPAAPLRIAFVFTAPILALAIWPARHMPPGWYGRAPPREARAR